MQSGEQVRLLVNFRLYGRRKNYELAQKNETECFQVLNMASPPRGNLQAIRLLPDVLWHYQREVWLKFMRYC